MRAFARSSTSSGINRISLAARIAASKTARVTSFPEIIIDARRLPPTHTPTSALMVPEARTCTCFENSAKSGAIFVASVYSNTFLARVMSALASSSDKPCRTATKTFPEKRAVFSHASNTGERKRGLHPSRFPRVQSRNPFGSQIIIEGVLSVGAIFLRAVRSAVHNCARIL